MRGRALRGQSTRKLSGDGPDLWVRMQAAHDTWHAAREVDTSRIPTLDTT